jgi:hypothetical protein
MMGGMSASLGLMNSGVNKMVEAANVYSDRIKKRARDNAINEVLGMQLSGDPQAAQAMVLGKLSRIDDMDPVTALGLTQKITAPYYLAEQQRYDRSKDAYNQGIDYLNATKTQPKGYGAVVDDYGNIVAYNKDDGTLTTIKEGECINPSHVVLKPVTTRDSNGVEQTVYVPFNKLNGQPLNQPSVSQPSVSQPTSTQPGSQQIQMGVKMPVATDKQNESAEALSNVLSLVNNIAIPTDSQSGPIDSRIDDISNWFNVDTKDGINSSKFDADLGNLITGFGTAQVKGVLSDKDSQYIEDQMPSRRYSPAVNKVRIDNIKRKVNEAVERWNKAHPYNQVEPYKSNQQQPVKKGSKYGEDTEIISF